MRSVIDAFWQARVTAAITRLSGRSGMAGGGLAVLRLAPSAAEIQDQVVPGLLSRLFRGPASRSLVITATVFPGNETLEVVGESRHQDTLWQIVGGFRRDRVRHPCRAVLLPEPDNP